MKKMLIVGITMSAAGTENSFVNFAKHIDFSQWQVDLLLAKREGDFLDLVPKEINVLDMGEDGELFVLSKDNSKAVINGFYQNRPFTGSSSGPNRSPSLPKASKSSCMRRSNRGTPPPSRNYSWTRKAARTYGPSSQWPPSSSS